MSRQLLAKPKPRQVLYAKRMRVDQGFTHQCLVHITLCRRNGKPCNCLTSLDCLRLRNSFEIFLSIFCPENVDCPTRYLESYGNGLAQGWCFHFYCARTTGLLQCCTGPMMVSLRDRNLNFKKAKVICADCFESLATFQTIMNSSNYKQSILQLLMLSFFYYTVLLVTAELAHVAQ